ncbi:MAG: HNH endonuclease signature motif containing protein [Candidatus Cybelea sp.]
MHQHHFQRRVEILEAGLYSTTNFGGFLRRYLIRGFGESCTRCGWAQRNPVTKNVPIEVEHIDGDWRNNRLDNLTLLCPNCHALTSTFRGLNRGRGRAHRLGGRGNPLRFHKTPVKRAAASCREVIPGRSIQLPLLLPT